MVLFLSVRGSVLRAWVSIRGGKYRGCPKSRRAAFLAANCDVGFGNPTYNGYGAGSTEREDPPGQNSDG